MKKTILFLVLNLLTFNFTTAQSWTKIFEGEYFNGTSVYFTDVNAGYIATDNGKIYKTTDAGTNWKSLLTGVKTPFTAIRFTNSNTGYVCGSAGVILKTTDAGTTWTALNSGTLLSLNCIFFTDDNTGYIAGKGVILKTIDAGVSWVIIRSGPITDINSLYFTDSNTGFAVGESGTLLKTINSGTNWVQINTGTTQTLRSIYFTSLNVGYISGDAGILRKTLNSGTSWLDISNSSPYFFKSVFFTDANTGYVIGKDNSQVYGIIGKTTNAGVTWTYKQLSTYNYPNSIFFTDQNNGYIADDRNVLTKTFDAGNAWSEETIGNPETLRSIFFTDDNTGYSVSEASTVTTGLPCKIKKTIDGGKNWNIIHKTSGYYLNQVLFTNPNTGFAVGGQNISKTIDAGATWTTKTINTAGNITSICFTDDKTGYVTAVPYGQIYKTIDGGNTWSLLVSGVFERYFISISFIDAKTGFAVGYNNNTDGIMYKTSDGGVSWTSANNFNTNLFSIYFTSAKIGFCVGSNGSIYRSSDLGKTWTLVNSGSTDSLRSVYFADDNIGYIGGLAGTILKSTDAGITWTKSINGVSGVTPQIWGFYFPRVYTGYAVGSANTVLKNDTCNSFTADLSQTNVNCFEVNNGSASATVRGGTPPFTYLWSNGQTTSTISGLSPGLYTVTVNMTGQVCPITKSVTITGPSAPLTASFVVTPNTKCSGVCDGALTINAMGGTSPYTYQWNAIANNQTTKTITGLCSDRYRVVITDANGCKLTKEVVLQSTSNFNGQVYLTNIAAVDQVSVSPAFTAYYTYNLPAKINPNATNLRNFVDPGKKARFKVECTNKKANGQSIVSGICEVRSNCPYITITDNSSALNNIGWNNKAWSADEFEIDIKPETPAGTIAYIDFIVKENGIEYITSCIPLPITPLNYSPTTSATIDDDSNPDSNGNDNNICEPNEIIEFYPWLDNIATLNAEYVRGRFENLDNLSYINIWNNRAGVGTTVFDTSWWNFAFGQPAVINSNSINTTPEYDFVFNYNNPNKVNNFKLYMVMAGGFKLFPGTALSLVQWSLPYTFNEGALSTSDFLRYDNLMIYPNPGTTNIKINNSDALMGNFYSIIDISGRVVAKGILATASGIDVSKLSKGVYIIRIGNDFKSKFIKE